VSSVVKVPAAACHRRRDTCQWPQVPFFCILDALAADRSRLRDPATVCCGDDRSSAACARRNATEHLPPRVGRHRRDTFNNCENLTPTASLQLAEHLWLPAPHSRLCSTSVVRTDRGSFGVYPNLRHVSTNLVGSICTPGTCLSVSSNLDFFTGLAAYCFTSIHPAAAVIDLWSRFVSPLNITRVSFETQPHR
jgi:hypothetical protein